MPKVRRGSISMMITRLSSRMMMVIALSALVGIVAMGIVLYETNRFLQYSRGSVTAADLLEDALEARLDAFKFRISGNTELAESFSGNVQEVIEGSALIRDANLLEDEVLAELDAGAAAISQYGTAFDRIVDLREPRNVLVNRIAEAGLDIRVQLTEIMESAYVDGDPLASVFAGRAQEALLLGRLYMERFLLNNQQENFDSAMEFLGEAKRGLDELLPELQNPKRRELAEGAKAGIDEFVRSGEEVFELIVERNAYRSEMDVLGPQFIASIEAVMDSMTQHQETIGGRLRLLGWIMIAILGASAGLALYTSKRTSAGTSSYIKNSIDRFVVAMTELANGKEDIDLGRPPDPGTELARMADALSIFRDNALERKALQAEQARQEEQQAAEREAQQQRDEAAKKEAQRRIDEERRALLERLEKSVGAVVSHAAHGDFSKRITVDFDEESLRNMAEGINQLLQNVDDGLGATAKVLSSLSQGDLTKLMDGNFEGAFKDLQGNTNEMVASLKSLIGDITGSTVKLSSSSNELRETSNSLSKQAERNAASLEETSAALDELTASIKQVSENIADANENARIASDTAGASSVVAADAAEAMGRISDASKEIAQVVTVINDISFQINLLALNAGVEAARAGDSGRGFSVVASEVRSLAQRATEAAKEIEEVIGRSETAVSEGVSKVTSAQESLDKISESVVGVSKRIDQISSAISEQVNGVGEINRAVAEIDQSTQKQAVSFEAVTTASSVLANEAGGLEQSAARFHTGKGPAASQTPEPESKPDDAPRAPEPRLPATSGNLAENLDDWEDF